MHDEAGHAPRERCYERGVRCLAVLLAFAACRGERAATDGAVDADGYPYPPPRTDVVPAIGSADTLEIATWNIENYPALGTTPARVAELITSLDLDIVVVEEIASETAWRELLERLRVYSGVLSEHRYTPTDYQKLGIIYKTALVTSSRTELLFPANTFELPRPPLAAQLAYDDGVHAPLGFRVIGLHLKAGLGSEDGARRRAALELLDAHVREQIAAGAEDEIVIAGDYNDVLNTAVGRANLAPLLDDPELYTVHTRASSDAGEISFVPSNVLLDHVTTTAAFADELAGARVVIPRLYTLKGYVAEVSDHLPVVLVTPLR